jgi:hypothetical protein
MTDRIRTEAGKRLLADGFDCSECALPHWPQSDDIAAIEAEAFKQGAAAALAEVRREVEGLTTYNAFMAVNDAGDREVVPMVEVAAVGSLLERLAAK